MKSRGKGASTSHLTPFMHGFRTSVGHGLKGIPMAPYAGKVRGRPGHPSLKGSS